MTKYKPNTIDFCQTGYDYEQYQLNELVNENMKLKKKLDIAVKALKEYAEDGWYTADQALIEMEGVK